MMVNQWFMISTTMVPSRQSPLPGSKRLHPASTMRAPKRDCLGLEQCSFEQALNCNPLHKLPKLLGKKVNDLQSWVEVLRNPDSADCSQLFLQGLPPMDSGDRSPPTCQVSSAGHLRAEGGRHGETTESRKRATSPISPPRIPEIIVPSYPFPARSHLVSASCSATGNS